MTTTNRWKSDDRQRDDRRVILRKYARLNPSNGVPKFCHPSDRELAERAAAGRPKLRTAIIFDSVEVAQACEAELRALDGRRQWAYACKRSRHGHAHLTSSNPDERD